MHFAIFRTAVEKKYNGMYKVHVPIAKSFIVCQLGFYETTFHYELLEPSSVACRFVIRKFTRLPPHTLIHCPNKLPLFI